jgi:hypothetical protein
MSASLFVYLNCIYREDKVTWLVMVYSIHGRKDKVFSHARPAPSEAYEPELSISNGMQTLPSKLRNRVPVAQLDATRLTPVRHL